MKCKETGICNVVTTTGPNTHYLDIHTNTVITCISDAKSCILEDPSIKGYFINSDSDDKANKIIKCNPGESDKPKCKKISNIDSCGNAGCLKVDNVESPTSVTLCLTSECNNDDEIIVTSNNQDIYKIIKRADNFPGNDGETSTGSGGSNTSSSELISTLIKIGSDESVILIEDTGLPACVGTSVTSGNEACFDGALDGQYCIHSDKKIYKTTIGDGETKSCTAITSSDVTISDGKALIYFNNVYEKINEPTSTTLYVMAYLCSFDSEALKSCEFAKGYIINSTNSIIQCNGWKRDGCKVSALSSITESACSEGEGILNNHESIVLCFNDRNIKIPSSVSTDYVAFTTSSLNPIYGFNYSKETINFLELTKTSSFSSVIISSAPGNINIYIMKFLLLKI